MMPSAKSCAPLKIAMIEARKAKPGTAARFVPHRDVRETSRPPGEQDVDRDVWPAISRERVAESGAEDAEGADVPRRVGTHRALKGQLRDARPLVAKEPMLLVLRCPIDDVHP